ncbi:MAG: hypothetical protein ACFFDN_35085 [Candidatus Hodarchaeota archaeon]
MFQSEKSGERDEDFITMKWAILAIMGLVIISIGVIVILTREMLYGAIVDDLAILIYILSDYSFIKFGFTSVNVFFILSVYTSNYFLEIMTKQFYFGLILCTVGEILSIMGFTRVYQLNKHFWSELLDKFEI